MPIHSIVSEQDIFSSNEKIETKQVRVEDGIMTYMKQNGKTTFLEVVSYTEEQGLEGAKIAAECKCDILMGTIYFDSIKSIKKINDFISVLNKISKENSNNIIPSLITNISTSCYISSSCYIFKYSCQFYFYI